jgi:hypothetical protein
MFAAVGTLKSRLQLCKDKMPFAFALDGGGLSTVGKWVWVGVGRPASLLHAVTFILFPPSYLPTYLRLIRNVGDISPPIDPPSYLLIRSFLLLLLLCSSSFPFLSVVQYNSDCL